MILRRFAGCLAALGLLALVAPAGATDGYYRYPALAGDTVVFSAEGDLWKAPIAGGRASRVTTHPAEEWDAVAAPDGKRIAFAASYDGPVEVYVMPLAGGLPHRITFEGTRSIPVGWTPAGEVLTIAQNPTGPNLELIVVAIDPDTLQRRAIPLADVSDAAVSPDGKTLFFTRFGLAYSGEDVEAYRGGMSARLWRYDLGGSAEATAIGGDTAARVNDRRPMPWGDRLYFISDRDGHDNLWSMAPDGSDPRELTHETEFGIRGASLGGGRIVYQLGADIHVYDIAAGGDRKLDIDLTSDLDQERKHLVKKPLDYFEAAEFAPGGERIAVTARGRIALMGVGPLRRVDIATPPADRAGTAVVSPDGKWVYTIVTPAGSATGSDTAAPQIWRFPADGSGDGKPLTSGDAGYRWGLWLSPDGKSLANAAIDGKLYLLDLDKGENQPIDTAPGANLDGVVWSPDSRYLAIVRPDSPVDRDQIFLYEPGTRAKARLTSDRYMSGWPAFTPDGKWLYFLSDRHFESSNTSPWGDRNLGPYFDRRTRIYALALQEGLRFPFRPKDELAPPDKGKNADHPGDDKAADDKTADDKAAKPHADKDKPKPVDWTGLADRLYEVPVSPGNYRGLQTDGKLLYYLDEFGHEGRGSLKTLKIDDRGDDPEDFLGNIRQFALSADRKKLFIRRWAAGGRVGDMYIVPAGAKAPERLGNAPTEIGKEADKIGRTTGDFSKLLDQVDKFLVRASDWTIVVDPKAEWRQMFGDAWRLHRDFFYDRSMLGVDWLKLREKYRPLVDRIASRAELNDVLAQMMAELHTLHAQIRPGDVRVAEDGGKPAFLGAVLTPEAGGARITHIYRSDPELPDQRGPLAITAVDAREGDLITAVNGQPVSGAHDIAELLVGRAGQQVLLTLKRRDGTAPEREVKTVVKPVDGSRNWSLRYSDWEEGRRAKVAAASGGRIGYLHLRAMGSDDIADFAREFYAQYDRQALIIDVRRNNGGNIDSWVIEKLLRRAWAFWKPRYGDFREHNMQQAFRGHLAVLIDERTYSDGETFSAGIKALGIAPLIGARTAGAGVWLRENDTSLADRGIARTAEYPQFSIATGEILVENKGVDPDIPVDNPPHATFEGEDAQLDTAIRVLLDKLKTEPVPPL
ncbi:MAG TPA: S41 family peptidase [Stellaceae bacterium]